MKILCETFLFFVFKLIEFANWLNLIPSLVATTTCVWLLKLESKSAASILGKPRQRVCAAFNGSTPQTWPILSYWASYTLCLRRPLAAFARPSVSFVVWTRIRVIVHPASNTTHTARDTQLAAIRGRSRLDECASSFVVSTRSPKQWMPWCCDSEPRWQRSRSCPSLCRGTTCRKEGGHQPLMLNRWRIYIYIEELCR